MPLPNPVIVVPGITAVFLKDFYPLSPDVIWSVVSKDYRRSSLHPDNRRFERIEPANIVPDHVFQIAYEELIEELRHNLTESEDKPVPVYPFSYDWRQPIETAEEQLGKFVEDVITRTKLTPHYYHDRYTDRAKVNLIGHSMGGLVIAGYLQKNGENAPVDKVVTLASPFRGSFEPVLKIATGNADMGTDGSSSREREAARLTPSLYQLLPKFAGALQVPNGVPNDIFNAEAWQPSVVATLTQFIKSHGLDPTNSGPKLLTELLDGAKAHRERLENFSLDQAGLDANDWLCIVGLNRKTRIKLNIKKVDDKIRFDLRSTHRKNEWKKTGNSVLTGDGTVPYLGARNSFIPVENIVCVIPDDYSYWEMGDRALALDSLGGFHGMMSNMNMLHRLITYFFKAGEDDTPPSDIWGRPAPDIPPDTNWNPPIKDLRNKNKK